MTVTVNEHAKFAPSASARWVQCPGSINLCKRYPELTDSEKAREGIAGHWAWGQLLANVPIKTGMPAPNGILLTDEMCEGAEMFAAVVRAELPPAMMVIEQQLPPSRFIHLDNWGTPDVWGLPAERRIVIIEYKFGHDYVEVFHNWQMVNYAALILDMLQINGHDEQATTIDFIVVQPRSYHRDGPVRRWKCVASDLRSQRNVLHSATVSAENDNAPCFVNPECSNCSARAFCPTLQRAAYNAAEISMDATPVELPAYAVGLELTIMQRAASRLKARIGGLEEIALATAKAGGHVPGFIIEQGNGRQAWNKPIDEVIAMGDMLGIPLAKPGAITPKQALDRGANPDVIAAYSERPIGAVKLVPDDGTRAAKVFRAFENR